MRHDDISMLLQNREREEDVEVCAVVVGPQGFPKAQAVGPFHLALVPDEQLAEEEEEICGFGFLEMFVEFRIHELDKMVQC